MNYTPIKNAMRAIGHVVSEGEQWLVEDMAQFRDFAHHTLGVLHDKAYGIIQYPEHFAPQWDQIHSIAGIPAPAAAPIEASVEAPQATEETKQAPVVADEIPAAAPEVEVIAPEVVAETPVVEDVESTDEAASTDEVPDHTAPLTFNVLGDKE